MNEDWNAYRIFAAVAETGNITYAAKALYLSQPTVSRCMAQLEEALGCRLFVRTKKGVSLTPEAELLYAGVEKARRHIADAEEALYQRRALREGTLRIGASETTLQHYLLGPLERFRKAYPGIRLKILNGLTDAALQALRDGLVDLAVVVSPVGETDGLSVTPLCAFRDIAVAGSSFASLRGRTLTLSEMCAYPLVCLIPGTHSRQYLDQFFARQGLTLAPDIELSTADLLVPVVRRGLGIGFVPQDFAREAIAQGDLFELSLKESPPPRSICAISTAGRPLSFAADTFLSSLLHASMPNNFDENTRN